MQNTFRPGARSPASSAAAALDPAEIALVGGSHLFDAGWYRRTQAQDLPQDADPVRHYLQTGAAAGHSPGPSFDAAWYLAQNPDVAAAGIDPLLHYLQHGRAEARPTCRWIDPADAAAIRNSDLFEPAWYRRTQAPTLPPGEDPLLHYLRDASEPPLHPGPSFDAPAYLAENPDVAQAGEHPLLHYIRHGRAEHRRILPVPDPDDVETILCSLLFDPAWYRRTQAPPCAADTDIARYYLQQGAAAGHHPGPAFDGGWYRQRYPDAAAHNPLVHYLRIGRAENRCIHRVADAAGLAAIEGTVLFDAAWYRRTYAQDLHADADPARHFLHHGASGAFDPGPGFDAARYLEHAPDVAAAGLNPLLHYLAAGRAEGRPIRSVPDPADLQRLRTSALFDPAWYRQTQAPHLSPQADPARHYLQEGAPAGLAPGPQFDPAWYLRRYPDAAGADPLLHYLRSRLDDGRERRPVIDPADADAIDASGLFDADWYRRTQASDPAAQADPIRHYLQDGAALGLDPGPLFDAAWYRRTHPAASATGVNPLLHHLRNATPRRTVIDPATMRLVAATGLFDPAWYRRTHAPGLPPDVDPLRHYLQDGAADGHNPGPFFDAAWYWDFYRDVAAAGMNPIVHFAQRGTEENRCFRNVAVHAADDIGPMVLQPLRCNSDVNHSVAVMVHAFYPDIFEQLCPMLRAIPGRFTLLVAVGTEQARQTVERAVRHAALAARLVCRIVPNRGRNFGSFLATFPAEILRHDIVLHLHTKRSLYTGREQVEWRDALYHGLVGTAGLVRYALGLFAKYPSLGLFYPEIPSHLPYWAHHWLSNAHLAPRLFERLGIADFPRHGYFDYPVGGMFWARVDAIRPLLEAGLDYDDFPPEAAQTDGTLAHAIERAIGLVPKALGYGFVEHDSRTGALRDNWSRRNTAQYALNSPERFATLCTGRRLISFDIFDTLLVRAALTPDAVLHYVGHRLATLNGPHPAPPDDFFVRRKQAEALARSARDHVGDVDLDDIYAAFAPDVAWPVSRIAAARSLECSTDAASLRLRPGARDLLSAARASGARIVAISDTYYTRADIDSLLAAADLAASFDAIYISSNERARKDRGDLWDRVEAQERIARTDWLHVGDNEHSDIQAACDRGIGFFHLMAPALLLERDGFRRPSTPDATRWSADLIVGPAMLRVAGSPFRPHAAHRNRPLHDAREAGYVVFGPVIFLFMSWLIRHPALRHVSRLYFLAREGFLLHRTYEAIRARFPPLSIPPGSYFHASRRSTLSAVQARAFLPHRLVSGAGFTGTLQDLLRNRIGLDLPDDFVADGWTLRLPEDADATIAALQILENPIVAHAGPEADSLIAYGRQAGMASPGRSGVVDIGYSATIQKNLQLLLDRPLVGFYMGCHGTAHEVEEQDGVAFGCFAEEGAEWTSDSPVLRHSLLMEAFLTAPHGQLLSFTTDGASVTPVFKPRTMTRHEEGLLADLHGGALDYVQELLDLHGSDLLFADHELTMPQEFVRLLMARRLVLPPDVANLFRVEDEFCGNGELKVAL